MQSEIGKKREMDTCGVGHSRVRDHNVQVKMHLILYDCVSYFVLSIKGQIYLDYIGFWNRLFVPQPFLIYSQ